MAGSCEEPAGAGPLARAFGWAVTRLSALLVVAWIAGAAAMTIALPSMGAGGALSGIEPEHSPALAAERASAEHFAVPVLSRTMVVQRDPTGLSAAAQARALARAGPIDAPDEQGLRGAIPLINVRALLPSLPENRTTALTFLLQSPGTSLERQTDNARAFAAQHVDKPGDALVGVSGTSAARVAQTTAIHDALPIVTAVSVILILLVVGLRFRSALAPLLALAAAAIAYLVVVHLIGWMDERLSLAVPEEAEPVIVVLLLGVVTDYSIFFLEGVRARLAEGHSRTTATAQTACATTPIVLTAGLLVAASTATLVLGRSDFFRAFGPGLALTALVAAAVTVTFVPAALSLLGRAAFWPHGPGRADPSDARAQEGWRFRVARFLTARPIAFVLAAVSIAAMAAAATGLRDLHLGYPVVKDLPASAPAARAANAAARGFGPGIMAPTEVLVQLPDAAGQRAALHRLGDLIRDRPDVATVVAPGPDPPLPRGVLVAGDDRAARLLVLFGVDPLSARGVSAVRDLRADLPRLTREAGLRGATASVAGDAALAADTIEGMLGDLIRVAVAALLVTFVVLALFLRSLLAPLLLMCASVLALGAAMGLTVYVFHDLAGFGGVTWYVPFTAGVMLIALGADYNVFVAGRVWQAARRRPLREAIALAAPRSARTLILAGLTLALSFAALAIVPLRSFRELAFALAAGILLETFLVRSVLVPSLLALVRPRVPSDRGSAAENVVTGN